MEERFLESAEEAANMFKDHGIATCSKQAIPDEDLKPEQYKQRECKGCGDDLPDFRMKKGLILCTSCQSAKEKGRPR